MKTFKRMLTGPIVLTSIILFGKFMQFTNNAFINWSNTWSDTTSTVVLSITALLGASVVGLLISEPLGGE